MKNLKYILLMICLCFVFSKQIQANGILEKEISERILIIQNQTKQVYPHILECTVSIGAGCSGVIVSEDGYVLTASHVIENFMQTGEKLSVKLKDGIEHEVERLGRSKAGDFALLKLKGERKWPFVKIGQSNELVSNEVCLMLGHSGGYLKERPAVLRSGFVRGYTNTGFLRTTCTMMPGDSGGPLFNLKGELIGINSYCWEKEFENYFSPVDRIMSSWDRLKNGEEFEMVDPNYSNKTITKATLRDGSFIIPKSEFALTKLIEENNQVKSSIVFPIFALGDDDDLLIHATQISEKGVLVSKSSMIKDDIASCKLKNGTYIDVKVIGRNTDNDLVFLQSDKLPEIVALQTDSEIEIGDFIGRINSENQVSQTGIIGVKTRNVPILTPGMFGMEMDGLKIVKVYNNSNSFMAGLKDGDEIISINSTVFNNEEEYKAFMSTTYPNQVVSVKFKRMSQDLETSVRLGPFASKNHPAYMVEVSNKKEGFANAFTFDIALKPIDCGTPVVNLNGEIIGVTIARSTRTCSFAIPIELILSEYLKIKNTSEF